jgi:hypothetical protein
MDVLIEHKCEDVSLISRSWRTIKTNRITPAYLKARILQKDKTDDVPGKEKMRHLQEPEDPRTKMITLTETGARMDGLGRPVLTPTDKDELEMYTGSSDGAILRWIPNPDVNRDTWLQTELCRKAANSIVCLMHYAELDLLITGELYFHNTFLTNIPYKCFIILCISFVMPNYKSLMGSEE